MDAKHIFLLRFVKQGPRRSTSAPFPKQKMSTTSSLPNFQRSQGLTSPLCTPSMVLNTSSRSQALPSMHGPVGYLQTGWLRPRPRFSKWNPWGSFVTQIVHGHPRLHKVPKVSGGWCFCRDYRRLNEVTIPDRYLVPHVQDFLTDLAEAQEFSKIDLVKGYHQIPVAMEDIPTTAIITPFSLYEFLRMPFGLKNSVQTFQRLMNTVCCGLDAVFVHMDDILVASPEEASHKLHLGLYCASVLGITVWSLTWPSVNLAIPPSISLLIKSQLMVPCGYLIRSKLSLPSGNRAPSTACRSL